MQINLDILLNPIDTVNPCGVDVRNLDQSSEGFKKYFLLRELRNDERRKERKNIEAEETLLVEPKEWQEIVSIAVELLSVHTKDLEIGAWLVEGLVRVDQFAGLALGLKALAQLIKKYENSLYPHAEDDESEDARLTSIAMLGGKYELGSLVVPVYYHTIIPTVAGSDLNAWSIRQLLGKSEDTRTEMLMECDALKSAIMDLNKGIFAAIKEGLELARDSFKEFNSALSSVFSRHAPNVSGLENVLTYCCGIVATVQGILDSMAAKAYLQNEIKAEEGQSGTFSLSNFNPENLTREDAIQMINIIAKFFAMSEPHSPISYSLNRLVAWANLDLPSLLEDIGISDNARGEYCKITGVPFLSKAQGKKENYYNDD